MIYFLKNGDAVKIGYAASPSLRTDYLQTGSPYRMEVLGAIEGGYEDENALHQRFAHLRISGEWFRLDKEMIFFLADILNPDRCVRIEDGHDLQSLTMTGAPEAEVQIHDDGLYVHVCDTNFKFLKTVVRFTGVKKLFIADNRFHPLPFPEPFPLD